MLASRPRPQRTGKYLKLNNDFVFDHCAAARVEESVSPRVGITLLVMSSATPRRRI
jgi:hypothetical protein